MKKTLSLLAVAALAFSLAACSSTTGANGCTPTAAGTSSDKVKVSGDFGKTPTVSFSKGLSTKKTERTVVTDGKGTEAKANSVVGVDYTIYDGASGKKLDQTKYAKGSTASFQLKSPLLPGIVKGLTCSSVGTRVVAVVPPADAFGSTGSTGLGVKATDSLVLVFDVQKITAAPKVLPKANGAQQKAEAGYPTVVLAANGAPTITVPKTPAPTTLMITDLKKGSGTIVKAGDTVTVHYTGVIWNTGVVFDSSWANGAPVSFPTTGVIPGFTKALVGQKVGSQVIAVIPPADGYGTAGKGTITGTDTLVFVIDILATAAS